MPEWSIGTVSKTVVLLRVPRVRIPLSPLLTLKINVLANKYPNKYPKTNFFGYFSYIRVPIMKPEAPARLPALV